jgi:pimeloyl-ACP methyl ester carboxylesterase
MTELQIDVSRRRILTGAVGLGLAAGLPMSAASQGDQAKKESDVAKPSIVFVHGIWADGSSFQKLIPTLRAEGHEVIASQYGLDSLQGDVDAVIRTIGRVSAPIVLVGHSYGGTLITHAGMDPRVAALVYIAALAPDAGETSQSLLNKFPAADISSHVEIANGRVWMKPEGIRSFAGDLSPEEQGVVWSTQAAPVADLFTQKLDGGIAWRAKPSWYIVGTEDRTVQPDLERFLAKRMGATTVELSASHVSMLSQPRAVLDVIRNAATAAASAKRG